MVSFVWWAHTEQNRRDMVQPSQHCGSSFLGLQLGIVQCQLLLPGLPFVCSWQPRTQLPHYTRQNPHTSVHGSSHYLGSPWGSRLVVTIGRPRCPLPECSAWQSLKRDRDGGNTGACRSNLSAGEHRQSFDDTTIHGQKWSMRACRTHIIISKIRITICRVHV